MKIGIIGGGISGLASAWLLEEMHDIVLFEKQDRLGGHANTVLVSTPAGEVPVETGFEFFNDAMFPHFVRLLALLKIPTQSYSFNYTFSSDALDTVFMLPPWRSGNIFWDMVSLNKVNKLLQLKYLVQLKYIIDKSEKFLCEKDVDTTIEQFLNQTMVTDSFKNDFFIPIFCAGWGVSPEKFRKFSAYNLLCWIVKNKAMGLQDCIWKEIPTGMISYITALIAQIKRAQLKTSANIQSVTHNGTHYIVTEANGIHHEFDQLIVATNAYEARDLLQKVPQLQSRCALLNKIEYIKATLAAHGDERFMPKDKKHWSVANVWHDGKNSALTTHKPWRSPEPLFRSWLMPGFPRPEPLYYSIDYYHAEITPGYFHAQDGLAALQGEHNVWMAGLYTYDIDSHECAFTSALKIAERIAPESIRYKAIMQKQAFAAATEDQKGFSLG